jgi:hypothetical protein
LGRGGTLKMTDLEKDILHILKFHVGDENKLTQYEITAEYNNIVSDVTEKDIGCRYIRRIIEDLIEQGYPIVSTPKNGGGYHWQKTNQEGLDCAKRIRRQAVKLFLKARHIRANSRMGQLNLDIRV